MFFPLALFLKKYASRWCRRRVFPWPGNSAPVFPDRTAGLSSDRLPASSAQLQHQHLLAGVLPNERFLQQSVIYRTGSGPFILEAKTFYSYFVRRANYVRTIYNIFLPYFEFVMTVKTKVLNTKIIFFNWK
jgi:hypothetical protein